MSKIAVTLELTQSEAETLQRLLMDGVYWSRSGKFGKNCSAIYNAIDGLEFIREAKYRPQDGTPNQTWVKEA